MTITARYTEKMMIQMRKDMANDDFDLLDQVHHFMSGGKAFFCLMAHEGVDEMRRCCGGAGYSQYSMLPETE
jgi:acyl-CoA oxidase